MPTALSIVENEDGFAVASDSAYYDMDTGTMSGYIDKIFPVDRNDLSIAYCLCGIVTFAATDKQGKQPSVFNLLTEVPNVLSTVDKRATFRQFADEFGKRICTKLRKATKLTPAKKSTETHVFLFGYHNGLPGLEIVAIRRNADSLDFEVFPGNAPHNVVTACFPGAVRDHLYDDPIFDRFLAKASPHSGIQKALEIARQSVLACYDHAVRAKYPEANVVGGPIHTATITAMGFRWIEHAQAEYNNEPSDIL